MGSDVKAERGVGVQMRRVPSAFIPLAALLLVACGPGVSVPLPDAASVALSGPPSLKLNAPLALSAIARDAAGSVIHGKTFVWASSAPDVVSVDASGTVTAKRLSVAPVTLTASADGQSSSLNLTTYGLELTMGTYNHEPGQSYAKVWTAVLLKFRDASGQGPSADAPVTLEGPGGFGTRPQSDWTVFHGHDPSYDWGWYDLAPVAGLYTASATVDGEPYTASASLDPASLLPGFTSATLSITAHTATTISYTYGGTPDPLDRAFGAALYGPGGLYFLRFHPLGGLPLSETDSLEVPPGTYTKLIYALNTFPADFATLTPAQFNMSRVSQGTVTLY